MYFMLEEKPRNNPRRMVWAFITLVAITLAALILIRGC